MFACFFALALWFDLWAQTPTQVTERVREYRQSHEHQIMGELVEFLAIPNVTTDTANILRNAERLRRMLEARGIRTRSLEIEGRGPLIFGELKTPGARRTVIFYAHYDGQPVDPSRWTDTRPFEPSLRTDSIQAGGGLIPFPSPGTDYQDDWRIYSRSSSDDKSPIVALLAAIDALREGNIPLAVNLKLILDSEEEAGSPHLERTVLAHRQLLTGDLLIVADGPVHQSGRPLMRFGNRGVMDVEITVYGPTRPLHSGHYGNWAPNPAMRLAELLATMKDQDGQVLIEGFYDDVVPLSGTERRALAASPTNEQKLMREMGFSSTEGGGKRLEELINLPSLNLRGLESGFIGAQARTIVPEGAVASLDMRLVKNIQPRDQFNRLVAHIRKQGYYVTTDEPTSEERAAHGRIARVLFEGGYPAARTPMDRPVAQALAKLIDQAVGGELVMLPTMGGSVPMYIFEELGLPIINVPMVNHDNNQHSADENLRVGNLWRGMEIYGAILSTLNW